MSLKGKNISKKETSAKKINAVVTDSVGNYEKHPFFIKKAVAAKALLLKAGLPKQLTRKAHA
jgi:hypothetical protein